jgi:polysaccharide biosynthesis protein PslG
MTPRFRLRPHVLTVVLIAGVLLGLTNAGAPSIPTAYTQSDPRYFAETGFRIGNDRFWDFFQRRGGVRTFGYPASREHTLMGFRVQFFQRAVMQLSPDGSVRLLNLLDDGLLPYTTINGSTFPAPDPLVIASTPRTTDPNYAEAIAAFVQQLAPDEWDGLPVSFYQAFRSTISADTAGVAGPGMQLLLNLEVWGAPTSHPMRDPTNHQFVYQRFQRGIAHYDQACGCTNGILLADALKSVITGQHLPPDLEQQARESALYRQYDPAAPLSIRDPARLPNTDLTLAFESEGPVALAPSSYRANSPEYGMNVFLAGNPLTTDRDLQQLTHVGFGWQKSLFQWRQIEGAGKGLFDWSESDRVVAASQRAGVKIIARIDFQPAWARADGATNGPPDNVHDFADFISAFVDRYRAGSPYGTVHAIEIWNEPNLDREWGGAPINRQAAAAYVGLLKAGYEAAKQADPSITVISAGLSPTCTDNDQARPDDLYLQWMYDAGAHAYFDVLGAHGAGYDKPPSASPQESANLHNGCRVFTFRRVEDLRAVMERNGDAQKQVWLLEFGWTTDQVHPAYAWHAVTPETHGAYLVDAYRWAKQHWSPWIGVMVLWNLPDPNWGPDREEYWWSVAQPDGTPRPALTQLGAARRSGLLP